MEWRQCLTMTSSSCVDRPNEIGYYQGGPMNNPMPPMDDDIPAEIDFGKATRGLHHVPAGARVLMPVSIDKKVWEYFAEKPRSRA